MRAAFRVSIGLPVFNGENYVQEAIEAILGQTFTDFELIISDNASTDRTPDLCLAYAACDARIRYVRNDRNIGGSANFRRVFELSSGEYFKWAAHDDVCRPEFLARCVEALDRDPSVILAYPRMVSIDAAGNLGKQWDSRPAFASPIPHERFREAFRPTETFPLAGVIRSAVLGRTPLLGSYADQDLPLLAELSLYGRFHEIPEFLFLCREHPERSVRVYDQGQPHQGMAWYDPTRAGRLIFPAWRLLGEYLRGILRAPIDAGERLRCCAQVLRWVRASRPNLVRDLVLAAIQIPGAGPVLGRARAKSLDSQWLRQHRKAARDLEVRIPAQDTLILADECTLDPRFFARWRTVPFIERNGQYWGPPPDDSAAIRELERLRGLGAHFFVFGWTTFWWRDHYAAFDRHLRSRFSCALDNDRLVVFDLRRDRQAVER